MNMAMLMCETLVLVLKKEAKPKYCGGRFVEYKWSDPVSDAHKPAQDWGRTNFFRVEVAKLVCSNILWFGILCCSFLVPGVTPLPECFMGIVAFWESIAVFLLVMCSSGQRRGIQHPAGLILVGLLVTIAFMWLVLSVTAFKPGMSSSRPRSSPSTGLAVRTTRATRRMARARMRRARLVWHRSQRITWSGPISSHPGTPKATYQALRWSKAETCSPCTPPHYKYITGRILH
mmetsp:Transcript_41713/g.96459  ORF Transcript_41713/g.96459 Transcript_41713/m.96459 type:complete len:232 (-) Transcript_41713:804-1499(-)